ncbi:hypothetical protein SAMN05421820_105439 [Pedobacter steynii]|uniref:Uncharacterized protein n=1 Tax=Pedobacter steynii TaxID=430522 RepID=A0A1G9XC29_9SPHI|nr:hypothetical protein SAMN05421820_105439 [Pedobacter steynii]
MFLLLNQFPVQFFGGIEGREKGIIREMHDKS